MDVGPGGWGRPWQGKIKSSGALDRLFSKSEQTEETRKHENGEAKMEVTWKMQNGVASDYGGK